MFQISKFKKSIGMALSLFLLTSIAGFTEIARAEKLKGEVVLWSESGYGEQIKPGIDRFNKLHPEAKIKLINFGWEERVTKFLTALAAGSKKPDACVLNSQLLKRFIIIGALYDVTEWMGELKENLAQADLQLVKDTKGRMYGITMETAPIAMAYRKDIFDKYGIKSPGEMTWEEFILVGKKMSADGIKILRLSTEEPDIWWHILYQLQGDVFNEQGEIILDTKEGKGIGMARFLKTLTDEGICLDEKAWTAAEWTAAREGRLAAEMFGVWMTYLLPMQIGDKPEEGFGKWRWCPFPIFPQTGIHMANYGGGAYVINGKCQNPKLTFEALKFLVTDFESQDLQSLNGAPSAYIPVLERGSWLEATYGGFYGGQKPNKVMQKLIFEWNSIRKMPPAYYEATDIVESELSKMLIGEQSPEEAIKNAADRIKAIVVTYE